MVTPRLHIPVMVHETIELLRASTLRNCIFADLTVGTGGHTEALLQSAPRATLIGMDRDASTLKLVEERLKQYSDRLILIHGDYRDARTHLDNLGIESVDGCLIDAGMSLYQVDTPERGISFRFDAPLDMRFDQSQPVTAAQLVNTFTTEQLTQLFHDAGETGWARSIAANIVRHRQRRRITSTAELVAIVEASIPAKHRAHTRTHPATRVFAAFRQAVNEELDAIEKGLMAATAITAVQGRIVILTYSSSEDRIAKTTLRRLSAHHRETRVPLNEAIVAQGPPFSIDPSASREDVIQQFLKIVTQKPLVPTPSERRNNPRARSAKLRAAERVGHTGA